MVGGPDLLARAVRLLGAERALLGITGAPGAGKSTVSEWLVARLNERAGAPVAAYVPMDGFHLSNLVLDALGLRDRKGAPQTFDAAGFAALLGRLREAGDAPVYAPRFHREIEESIAAEIAVGPEIRLVVVEGNYLLLDRPEWRAVRACMDRGLVPRRARRGAGAAAARPAPARRARPGPVRRPGWTTTTCPTPGSWPARASGPTRCSRWRRWRVSAPRRAGGAAARAAPRSARARTPPGDEHHGEDRRAWRARAAGRAPG